MTNKVFIGLLLFFIGAASYDTYRNTLSSHVARFEKLCNVKVNIPVNIVDKLREPTWIGVCYGTQKVEILKEFWDNASFRGREALVFHELGHCVLNRDHTKELVDYFVEKSIPKSIMFPMAFGEKSYYVNNIDYYHKELCNGDKK